MYCLLNTIFVECRLRPSLVQLGVWSELWLLCIQVKVVTISNYCFTLRAVVV